MSNHDYEELARRITSLEEAVFTDKSTVSEQVMGGDLNWSLNERAFVTSYAKNMTGTEKFVLLVAYLAKGEVDTPIALVDVEKLWGKMTAKSLLGMQFNRKYTSDAKARGWVDSAGTGKYQLTYGWIEIQHTNDKKEG